MTVIGHGYDDNVGAPAFRNVIINGSFDVWQRGTSFNPFGLTIYGPDRWQCIQNANQSSAFARVTASTSDPTGYNYYLRVGRTSGQSYTTPFTLQTSFESQNIKHLRGKYLTLSFWARCSNPYTAASSFLVSDIVTGTGTDSTVGSFTSNTVNTTANNVLTTSWQRFSITTSAVLATNISQLGVRFVFTPVGTAPTNDYFDITGVQLEAGSVATPFEFEPFETTLRKCQRYYEKSFGVNTVPVTATATDRTVCTATTVGTSSYSSTVMYKVPKRTNALPTLYNYAVNANNARWFTSAVAATDGGSVEAYTEYGFHLIISATNQTLAVFNWTVSAEL